MKFSVTLDRDEHGIWIVECPSIPGCVSQGQTRQQALENIKDADMRDRAKIELYRYIRENKDAKCGRVSSKDPEWFN